MESNPATDDDKGSLGCGVGAGPTARGVADIPTPTTSISLVVVASVVGVVDDDDVDDDASLDGGDGDGGVENNRTYSANELMPTWEYISGGGYGY